HRPYPDTVDRTVLRLPGGTHPEQVRAVLAAVRAALAGTGPAVQPFDPAAPAPRQPTGPLPAGTVLVLRTSGSTGTPRPVALTSSALTASAGATADRLGGPGRWLLALPVHHVAGAQVLVRSVLADSDPVLMELGDGFSTEGFVTAAARVARGWQGPRYTSLVPTQVLRLLEAGPPAVAALRSFSAVLVGGAALPAGVADEAERAGVRVVRTYGMTETCGGCVYDGVPLAGVRVAVEDGRVLLAGPVLAEPLGVAEPHTLGGAPGPARAPGPTDADADTTVITRADGRWLRTTDLGRIEPDGRLTVLGRADDVVVTGGEKVSAAAVDRAVLALPGIAEACTVGVPDEEWGHRVVTVVRADGPAPGLARVREAVRRTLGPAAAPRELVVVPELPLLASGKVDRAAVRALAATGGTTEEH